MLNTPVTPFAGVWIEIRSGSLWCSQTAVTPFAGVWIEIGLVIDFIPDQTVTPFAGVWIEIAIQSIICIGHLSLPSRECGLKFFGFQLEYPVCSHSLRGSVD